MRCPHLAPGPAAPVTLDDVLGDRLAFLTRLAEEFGPMVRYFGKDWQAVFVSSPSGVQRVLATNFRNYVKAETPDQRMLKPMLGEGLLTSDGPAWRAQRHALGPLFRRNSVEAFAPIVTAATAAMLAMWRTGETLEIGRELSQLTLAIAAKALFGHDIGGDGGRFAAAVEILNEAMGGEGAHAGAYLGHRTAGALAVVRDVVEQAIRTRRGGSTAADVPDALALLMAMRDDGTALGDEAVVDQGVTLLLAGHETTAKALSWALYLLSRNPEAAGRVRAEVAGRLTGPPDVDDLPRLPYTRAVLLESMRLYSPIWVISRIAAGDDEIDGYRVPAGTLVPISPYLMHRDAAHWSSPGQFRPERFIGLDEAVLDRFIPFGAGPRQCIGRHFALMEMHLALAMIASRFALATLSDAEVEPEALVTLRPRGGLWMIPREYGAGDV